MTQDQRRCKGQSTSKRRRSRSKSPMQRSAKKLDDADYKCQAMSDQMGAAEVQGEIWRIRGALKKAMATASRRVERDGEEQRRGETLELIEAAGAGDEATVQKLVNDGADVRGRDKNKRTALMVAAMNGKVEVLDTLLEIPDATSYINLQDAEKQTAMHLAAESKQAGALEALLKKPGVNLNLVDTKSETAAALAYREDPRSDAAKVLQEANKAKEALKSVAEAFYAVGKEGALDAVNKVLCLMPHANVNVRLNANGDTALHIAVRKNRVGSGSLLQALLDNGCTVKSGLIDMNVQNEQGDTPLHIAIRDGTEDLVKELLTAVWKAGEKTLQVELKNAAGKTILDEANELPSGEKKQLEKKEAILHLLQEPSKMAEYSGVQR
eukprot:gnl/TRDRNA2_/TRDRNA2_171995_c3_seq6.p1 gnl/TRDRNA2_/TRDRNA2_171995_c3~~gnl/TRDRNA2_/TRDRNA2_171995_c3_seq6.p1  ORF type:complete len:382 (+),score=86.49 gnl/TRDRNA2_/TRDRNA2_171995_c3_seq6:602-1747(+)